jgi:hypothetical protein
MANELSSNPEDWPREKIPPALKDWIVRNINVEEDLAAIREIERTGGHKMEDIIREIEERMTWRE